MGGVLFTNALMLAGLAAVTIPVVIHLLLKRKKKRLRFSTNRFFTQLDEQSTQRRKLRNLLLLSLRLLLVILLVCAFARPYLPRGGASAAAPKRQQVVFVLDRSASMQASGTDGERWRQAKEQIRKVLSSLHPDDRVALVGCSAHADVLSGFAPPASVTKTLNDLQPGYGTSDLGKGLQQAVKLVAAGDANSTSTAYVVSDLQDIACQNLPNCPLPKALEVKFISIGDLISPNLAITQLDLDTSNSARQYLTVSSFSDEPASAVNLELSVDGKITLSTLVRTQPASSTNVDLVLPALKPGWHDVTARIRSKDALEIDNTRYASLFVPEPSRVLIIESRSSKRVFEEETFFLMVALDPTKDSTNSVPSAFNLEQATPETMLSKLGSTRGQLNYDVIMMPGLKYLPAGCGQALTEFVQSGGGLLLFLGDGVSANRYNGELGALLPAQLGNVTSSTDPGLGWHIDEFDTNAMVFSAFRLPNTGNLRLPEFTKRYGLTPTPDSTTLAKFEDGTPLLLTRRVGRGVVALVNSSAETSWNDWPKHKTFVPWLHGLGKYLVQKPGHYQGFVTNQFVAETDFDLETAPQFKRTQFRIQSPGGKELLMQSDDQGRVRDPHLNQPGVYALRDSAGRELRRFAVNLPVQESNMKALRQAEVQNRIVRLEDEPKTTLAAGLFGVKSNQRELWSVLLLGVLGLLFAELIVANRTLA